MQSDKLFQQLLWHEGLEIWRYTKVGKPFSLPKVDLLSAKFLDHTSLLSFALPSPFPASQAFETGDHDMDHNQKDQNLMLLTSQS